MLTRLRELHDEMFDALARHEAMARDHLPDLATLSRARWTLTRVGLDLVRFLDNEVYPAVARLTPAQAPAAIRDLQGSQRRIRTIASRHIANWSIDRVACDWEGYRRDGAALRASIRKQIGAEKTLLYPLLALIGEMADTRCSSAQVA